jgi:hypothetical protein
MKDDAREGRNTSFRNGKSNDNSLRMRHMAEREGFEPSVHVLARTTV